MAATPPCEGQPFTGRGSRWAPRPSSLGASCPVASRPGPVRGRRPLLCRGLCRPSAAPPTQGSAGRLAGEGTPGCGRRSGDGGSAPDPHLRAAPGGRRAGRCRSLARSRPLVGGWPRCRWLPGLTQKLSPPSPASAAACQKSAPLSALPAIARLPGQGATLTRGKEQIGLHGAPVRAPAQTKGRGLFGPRPGRRQRAPSWPTSGSDRRVGDTHNHTGPGRNPAPWDRSFRQCPSPGATASPPSSATSSAGPGLPARRRYGCFPPYSPVSAAGRANRSRSLWAAATRRRNFC
jgi:hypothetical protein